MTDEHRMVIALTGGSGFVGAHILRKLLDAGYRVRALKYRTELPQHDSLDQITGSLTDIQSLLKLVKGADCVIHCGGAVMAPNAKGFFEANEKGTVNLIDAVEQAGVKSFLYLSSMAAREPDISPYAASKRAGEEALKISNIPSWDILRPPAIYGPGDKQILPLMQLLKKRIGLLPGGQKARVSVLYINDLVDAICAWLEYNSGRQHIYEIDDGCQKGYSWTDIMATASGVMVVRPYYIAIPRNLLITFGWVIKKICILIGQTPFITQDKMRELSHRDWVRHERSLESVIDWMPKTDFRTGIKKTLDWYKHKGFLV